MWQISLLHFLAFRYTVVLLLVIHWATCLQYAIPTAIGLVHGGLSSDSWIVKSGINNYTSIYSRYLRCLFRACCFLLSKFILPSYKLSGYLVFCKPCRYNSRTLRSSHRGRCFDCCTIVFGWCNVICTTIG